MDFLAYFAVKVKITHGDGGSYAPFFSALIHAAGMVTAEVEDPCCRRMENQRKMPKFQVGKIMTLVTYLSYFIQVNHQYKFCGPELVD